MRITPIIFKQTFDRYLESVLRQNNELPLQVVEFCYFVLLAEVS
jgi:hypothetical protein